ncbi:MAG: OB-fold nucleic acid binding domain-containing protein [Rhodobacteraceae bacterium]|nr:OB-fold nucleic acid binding domain-containing protein [Paracoccaceae bacterium]
MTIQHLRAAAPRSWPRPPAAVPHARLAEVPAGARVTVAGLVLVRQRPGTAKGVIFVTLEDETGVANVVVWAKVYERFRRAVIAGRLLRVTGRLQREAGVMHVVAERIEDASHLLDLLLQPGFRPDGTRAADQP